MTDEELIAEFRKPFTENIKGKINACFTNYIFYQREDCAPADPLTGEKTAPAGYICFCTRCRREFRTDFKDMCPDGITKKHKDKAKCPLCSQEGLLWHNGRGKKCLSERQCVVVFRRLSDTHVIAQGFYAYKAYNGDPREKWLNSSYSALDWDRDPEIDLSESTRYSFEPGRARFWKTRYDYISHESYYYFQEYAPREPFTGGFYGSYGYALVNRDVLSGTFMRYCADDMYLNVPNSAQRLMRYYALYAEHPMCEMLLKTGLTDIVIEAADYGRKHKRLFDWSAQKPREFFKQVSAQEFAEIVRVKPDIGCLKLWRENKALGLTIGEITSLMREYSKCRTLLAIMRDFKLTKTRAENYIRRSTPKKGNVSQTLNTWDDYLTLARRLEYDLTDERVYMPKKLYQAHDAAVDTFNAIELEEQRQSMEKRTKKLIKQFSFEYGGMMIVVPATMQDIINEGKALSHCVGGYAERHASGKTTILFLRRSSEPDVPFFTIEVGRGYTGKDPLHIIQCHGWKNERESKKPEEVRAFEKEFGAFIKDPRRYKKEHMKKAV